MKNILKRLEKNMIAREINLVYAIKQEINTLLVVYDRVVSSSNDDPTPKHTPTF